MHSLEKKYALNEINEAAKWLWNNIQSYKVIALHGSMGAGKTTLVNAVCKMLGTNDITGSPTFSIINQYEVIMNGRREMIFHIDLYRLKDEQEAINTGVEDCLYSGQYCFVEWPERAPHIFPEKTIDVFLHADGEADRTIQLRF